jgi:hypothetical protein
MVAREISAGANSATGLLLSEDLPIAMHVVFSNFIAFGSKQEYTVVHVTAGKLPVLDINIKYSSLDPHALDGLAPLPTIKERKAPARRLILRNGSAQRWNIGSARHCPLEHRMPSNKSPFLFISILEQTQPYLMLAWKMRLQNPWLRPRWLLLGNTPLLRC